MLNSSLKGIAKWGDFFSTSDCRDLLFHVQEHRLTIPQIKSFLNEQDLKFIGFDLVRAPCSTTLPFSPKPGWSLQDLDRWHAFETKNPDIFASMYQFSVQKA